MRRKVLLSLAILLVPAGGFAYSYWTSYLTDDFDAYLQKIGYSPLHPPRNEFGLGSLYDIDENGNFDLVCPTTNEIVANYQNYIGPDTQRLIEQKPDRFP